MAGKLRLVVISTLLIVAATAAQSAATTGAVGASEVSTATLEYQRLIVTKVAPLARDLPDFAGFFFDTAGDGRAVVLLTKNSEDVQALLTSVAPEQGIEFVVVANSYAKLQTAIDRTWEAWPQTVGTEPPVAVALNTIANGLDVYVKWGDFAEVVGASDALAQAVGVPLRILGSDPVVETTCGDRNHCTYPEKAGILIHRGSPTGTTCTMAFHVRSGLNEQFVTAGHCGYGATYSWYHQGLPNYGGVQKSNLLAPGGIDMMRVEMIDAQASGVIYPTSPPINGWEWAFVGEYLYVSAGASDRVVLNQVQDDYLTWTSGTCGCVVHGAKMSSTPGGAAGDSGSPVFALDVGYTYAVGTGSGSLGGSDIFARMGDAVGTWGITMVKG